MFESLASSDDDLPFWLRHNQSGKYGGPTQTVQSLELQSRNRWQGAGHKRIDWEFGLDAVLPYADNADVHFNELYAGISFRNLVKLRGGLFREESYLDGLSSTNTNILRALNARPYPRVSLTTDGFINPFSASKQFTFRAEYDEGFLNDDRVVDGAHLHHKSFYLRWQPRNDISLTGGIDHFVMWGGRHPLYGELPGFSEYLRYITGRAGNDKFVEEEQLNVAGNQLGGYHFQLDIKRSDYDIAVYLSHPFEDTSGMEWVNWRDNLIGIYVGSSQKNWLEKVLYEFMNTRHQSGPEHDPTLGLDGMDDDFNHWIYNSGYTYHGEIIGTPLFSPMTTQDGKVVYIDNNRVLMHHVGLMGSLSEHLAWDARLTYTRNQGSYAAPYVPAKRQFFSLLNLRYTHPRLPVQLAAALAGDIGQLYPNRLGFRLTVAKHF